jgi:hypothetical protein
MSSIQTTLDGKNPTQRCSKDGNIVIGFCTDTFLMLDLDLHAEAVAKRFSKTYSEFHGLGSALLILTSESTQVDLFGNKLNKYAVIFGKPLTWDVILWHIKEARRLGMIERSFLNLRKFGYITIRVNAKNSKTPPPKTVALYHLGDMAGIIQFNKFRKACKNLGKQSPETPKHPVARTRSARMNISLMKNGRLAC